MRPAVPIHLVLTLALAACGSGGGGGNDAPRPTPAAGQLDTSYASGGTYSLTVHTYVGLASAWRVAVANSGDAYLAGATITRLDGTGTPDPTFQANLASSAPLLDEDGNLYVLASGGIAKLDPNARLVAGFGAEGVALAPFMRLDGAAFVRDRAGNLVLVGPAAGRTVPRRPRSRRGSIAMAGPSRRSGTRER